MISEAEFSNMFRSEASALMLIPGHANLARFVTFDAGAKPKPILVMEFVEGPTLERVIESRALDVNRTKCVLHRDRAPYSFEFDMFRRCATSGEFVPMFNGGLVFHGPHDAHGSGGAPTFAVTLEPTSGWSVHT